MIIVRAAAGLVIEFGLGESGKWDTLTVQLAEGLSPRPFRFEVSAAEGHLHARPLEPRDPAELIVALGVLIRHQDKILAEVHKYNRTS
jgi:hypothetical protein